MSGCTYSLAVDVADEARVLHVRLHEVPVLPQLCERVDDDTEDHVQEHNVYNYEESDFKYQYHVEVLYF